MLGRIASNVKIVLFSIVNAPLTLLGTTIKKFRLSIDEEVAEVAFTMIFMSKIILC